METKEQLVDTIREWVQIDNEMKALQRQMKEKRERKKQMTALLMHTMKDNEIDCFELKDGNIRYVQNKVKAPLNKTTILALLTNYYQDRPEEAMKTTNYLLENREEKMRENIKRKIEK
jgi:hypothetical protein